MEKSKKIVLFDIDDTLFDTAKFIKTNQSVFTSYPDVEETLAHLKQIAELGIFSQGDLALQTTKLNQTDIEHYFSDEHTHIFPDKQLALQELVKKYSKTKKVFFVEDRLPLLYVIHKEFPTASTIWIRTGRYAPTQPAIEGFSPTAVVDNFPDIIPLIQDS
ncbi:MAG TPA: hypothetical protein VE090_03065 [Methylomirabilota bacterium]|nr:hypothetical protein [Methylomirabilota bacterium]